MCPTGKSSNESGFTLLELVVVMVLLALASVLGALSVPQIGDRLAVARTASRIERELANVAADAMRTGRDRSVIFTKTESMQALETGQRTERIDPTIAADWVAAAETGSDSSRGVIAFFGTGGASGGKLELARGDARAVIEVDWLTARVRTVW
jgi:general secretion pathway protein H